MNVLEKIKHIKSYKSYVDYSWDSLSKHLSKTKQENEAVFCNGFNVIFGENGSGKSAIVQILKSLSQNGEFINSVPKKITLQINNSEYLFEKNKWVDDKRLSNTDIVFFDTDFISTNIHTNGCRETAINKGAHTQNSGKLLIEFDGEAIKLKTEYEAAHADIIKFRENNKSDLEFNLTDNEIIIFEALKNKKQNEIRNILDSIPNEMSRLKTEIKQLGKNKSKITEIQLIEEITKFEKLNNLPDEKVISELFLRDLKEESIAVTTGYILNKLSTYEDFYKDHKDLKESDDCPFCGYKLDTLQAKKMLNIYQNHFDDTYEKNLKQFKNETQKYINNIKEIRKIIDTIPKDILKKQKSFSTIQKKCSLNDITNAPEIETMATDSFDKLLQDLDNLLNSKKLSFSKDSFTKIKETHNAGKKAIEILNIWINECNAQIIFFKEQNKSEEEIDQQIGLKNKSLNMFELTKKFINEDKSSKYSESKLAKDQEKDLEQKFFTSKNAYEKYLENLPKSTAKKMQEIVNNQFYLNFKLASEKVKIGQSKEYPFKFKIVDDSGKERSIDDGLSEGERQIISFAFFFAHLDNLPKQKRIIVFDDPVNSVDSKNLKVFVELIQKECKKNQVFLFTHHSLFYKYANKILGGYSFGIIKNKEQFGGSFIYREKPLVIDEKLKNMGTSLANYIKQNEMNYTIFTLEFGHLLRYTVEDFIKNKLLFWDKNDFTQVIDNIGKQNFSEEDLTAIRKIYDFCNWSNHLHPDKEEPASLNELQTYISKFLEVRARVN